MRTQLAALFTGIALIMLLPLTSLSADWPTVGEQTLQAIVLIHAERENGTGICTGSVINTTPRDGVDYVLTVAHCDAPTILVDGKPSRTIQKDINEDLLILEVADTGHPALRLAAKLPRVLEQVLAVGYGHGLREPILRLGYVSSKHPLDGDGGKYVLVDNAYVRGMSGGPVVNAAGEIISIVRKDFIDLGLSGAGAPLDAIRDRVGKYFETPKPEKPKG